MQCSSGGLGCEMCISIWYAHESSSTALFQVEGGGGGGFSNVESRVFYTWVWCMRAAAAATLVSSGHGLAMAIVCTWHSASMLTSQYGRGLLLWSKCLFRLALYCCIASTYVSFVEPTSNVCWLWSLLSPFHLLACCTGGLLFTVLILFLVSVCYARLCWFLLAKTTRMTTRDHRLISIWKTMHPLWWVQWCNAWYNRHNIYLSQLASWEV